MGGGRHRGPGNGETFFSHLISTQVKADGEVATGRLVVPRDVTLRRRLEDQLVQARRMEAVGRLAGGIAHDFNNLLTPILSYAELAANSLPEGSAPHGYLQEIRKAAKRAPHVTRQLLTFSRRQIVETRSVNPGGVHPGHEQDAPAPDSRRHRAGDSSGSRSRQCQGRPGQINRSS